MNRRDFLIKSGLGASALGLLPASSLWGMVGQNYTGPLVVMVHATGGWDVTSFCDPKINVPNELEITHWSRDQEMQQAGNIRYAPFGTNANFFEKYYRDMLVINGIDAQTNSHDVGVVHNFSGRLAAGFPALPALLSSIYAPEMPIAWVNNGSYTETANLIRYTRMDNPFQVKNIAYPNKSVWDGTPFIIDSEWERIQNSRSSRLADLRNTANLLPAEAANRSSFETALSNSDSLKAFADIVPPEEELEPWDETGFRRQAQIALLAFKSGVAMTADLAGGDFDTHDDHDMRHVVSLSGIADGVDYLWQYAEQLGLADRLTVIMASDFSRTPHYNEGNGKDHWPISSTIVMQKNAPWGNRMVGATDEGQNAIPINPVTLQPDQSADLIYPKDVMVAVRELLGIDNHPITLRFQFNDTVPFDFFNPTLQTPQGSDPRNTIR